MKYWYIVAKSNINPERLKVGDVLGFSIKDPNLINLKTGEPLAEYVFLGKSIDAQPLIDDIELKYKLIQMGKENDKPTAREE